MCVFIGLEIGCLLLTFSSIVQLGDLINDITHNSLELVMFFLDLSKRWSGWSSR